MSLSPSVLWHKAYSAVRERYLGIETRGMVPPPNSEGVHYTPLPYPMIDRMLDSLALSGDDVFADVGCGKGRVVCCAARRPLANVVAIELNPDLMAIARDNVRRVRGRRAPVEHVSVSAETYAYAGVSIAYLYNPFNERLTGLVLERLRQSQVASGRTLRIVYANPVHEALLLDAGWLEQYDEWPANAFPVFGYRVSFWRSTAGRA